MAEAKTTTETSMTIKWADLVPTYTRESNPNKMTASEFDALVGLMRAEGFLQSILVVPAKGKKGKWVIVDGHHRYWAAEVLDKRPVQAMVMKAGTTVDRASLVGIGMNRIRGEVDISLAGGVMQAAQEANAAWTSETMSVLTGYSQDEIDAVTASAMSDSEDVLADLDLMPAASNDKDDDLDDGSVNAKPFVLEIAFRNKEDMRLARRKLRKAAGASKDLARGLLSILGEDEDGQG